MSRRGSPDEATSTCGPVIQRSLGGRLAAACWTGGPEESTARLLAAGAVVWLAYALVWLAVEGPTLDEDALAAPIITGDVAYPPGHPQVAIYRQAPLLLYRLAALQWRLWPDPLAIGATRNVLFLFLSAFVPFAAALACTRRPSWGHVAAVLTLSESACSLVGVYLTWVFPGFFSTGHVGIHVAVLAIVLVAAGVARTGGFLAGLLPVVHGPMTLVAWPSLVGLLAWHRPVAWRPLVVGVLAGALVSGSVLATLALAPRLAAPVPAFAPGDDGGAVLAAYTASTDPHRQPLPLGSSIVGVGLAAWLGATLVLRGRRERVATAAVTGLVAVTAVAWTWVLGTRVWQGIGTLPPAVLAIMPARYANLAMLPTLALAVVVLAATAPARAATWLGVGLVGAEAMLLLRGHHAAFELVVYLVLGVACGSGLGVTRTMGLVATALLATAIVATTGADSGRRLMAFASGLVPAALASALVPRDGAHGRTADGVLALACLVVAAIALGSPHVPNQWDAGSERASADERGLASWLAANAPADAMLVAPLWPPTWLQGKTGHPVFLDTMTLANMAYFPATASVVGHMVRDVFGIDYADRDAVRRLVGPDGMLRPTSPAWLAAWQARDCEEWRALAGRYGFAFVWSERAHPVHLPVAWSGASWALHAVPAICPAGAS